jgi:hypothetical protein
MRAFAQWSQVESYVQKHSEATFTHGLCPDCIKKWHLDLRHLATGAVTAANLP